MQSNPERCDVSSNTTYEQGSSRLLGYVGRRRPSGVAYLVFLREKLEDLWCALSSLHYKSSPGLCGVDKPLDRSNMEATSSNVHVEAAVRSRGDGTFERVSRCPRPPHE